jgi:hypothetical protein
MKEGRGLNPQDGVRQSFAERVLSSARVSDILTPG